MLASTNKVAVFLLFLSSEYFAIYILLQKA